MVDLFETLTFPRGPAAQNRLFLAPLTNLQSHADGTLSDEEFHWLTMRAKGGFGFTMTCAAYVQVVGLGFPGQLGVFGDQHLAGLTRLAAAIRAAGSVSSLQLHHAGIRAEATIIDQPVGASDDAETGGRGLSTAEVEQLVEDFILAALRAERAGFDGVEVHGAHGYVLAQFLSPETNRREDRYGGSLENRTRIIQEIIDGIRARCRPDFQIGLRLSPERFGVRLGEMIEVARTVLAEAKIDYLDMSLWDAFKAPAEVEFQDRTLMSCFTDLPRGNVRLGVAGKITTPALARDALSKGADFVMIGRAAILHHDFPKLARANPDFQPAALPVSREHLGREGLSKTFIDYMATWKGFVAEA